MKLAFLVCTYPPYRGGMGNSAKQFAELAAKQHEVTIFTPRYATDLVDRTEQGVAVRYLKTPFKFGNAAWLPQLAWYLRKFDLTYLHYPFYGVHKAAYNFRLLYRRPLVTHYHMDTVEQGFKAVPFWLSRKFILPIVLFCSKKIVVSSYDYVANSNIAKYYKKHPEKFLEIPFWVDTAKFKPVTDPGTRDAINLLFVGGLDSAHYFKGLEVLFRALAQTLKSGTQKIQLTVVGDGELRGTYEKQASELGIENNVKFIGKAEPEGLVKAYQASDIFILPSVNKSEAFGLVLLEAMSCGVPVIASDLPGVRSVFVNNESGLTFEVGNVEALAEKIGYLIKSSEIRLAMGLKARQRVLDNYQVARVAQLLEKLYEDCRHK